MLVGGGGLPVVCSTRKLKGDGYMTRTGFENLRVYRLVEKIVKWLN